MRSGPERKVRWEKVLHHADEGAAAAAAAAEIDVHSRWVVEGKDDDHGSGLPLVEER